MGNNISTTDKLFKGISVQTIITITIGVIEIVVFSIMSRLLTKEDFGYYATMTALVSIFASISEAGLGSAVIQKKDASTNYLSTAFTLSLIVGSSLSLLLFILAPYLAVVVSDKTIVTPIRMMSIILLLNSVISIGRGILMRELKFLTVGVISIIAYIVSSIIGITMAYNGWGLYAVVTANVSNVLFVAILIIANSSVKLPRMNIFRKEAKEIFSFGGWLTMSVILNTITHQVDKLLLPKLISTSALGAYNRPAGFVSTITEKINGIFDTVLFPMLSGLQDDRIKVQAIFYRSIELLNSFSIILAAVFFFNAELIITIFFGQQWLDLVPILRIISIVVIFSVDNRLVDCFFRSLALVKLSFQLRAYATVQAFIFVILGAQFGIIGVAVSIMISNIVVILLKVFFLAKNIDASIIKIFSIMFFSMKPVLPILIVGIPFAFIANKTLIQMVVFAVIFTLIVLYEFVFKPTWVSKEYCNTIYPKVKNFLNKFSK